jgi:hypothetical protein
VSPCGCNVCCGSSCDNALCAAPDVGGKFAPQSVATAALHDPDRPAHGWTIAYPITSNIRCPPVPGNYTQQFFMQFRHVFVCEDNPNPTPAQTQAAANQTLILLQNTGSGCFLDVYSFGWAGCPAECPIVNGKLCGGNGICDYDQNIQKARCFCNSGYIESDCSTPLDPVPSGGIAGAFFGGLLVALGGVGAYWYTRVRSAPATSSFATGDGYYEPAE